MNKMWKTVEKILVAFVVTLTILIASYFLLFRINVTNLGDETIEANVGTITTPTFTWWGNNINNQIRTTGEVNLGKVGKYTLRYYWYNCSFVKQVTVVDTIKPELTLAGEKTMTVSDFSQYEEPGFYATDICDGDLTAKVSTKVEEVVENNKSAYRIQYSVEDSSGNEATGERLVYVSKGKVFLTFDDGPSVTITPYILDTLKKYNVKATFFLISFEGNSDKEALVKRMAEEGHSIAIHGVSHEYSKIYSSIDALMSNIQGMQEQIRNVTGIETNLIRFPGGSSNTVSKNYTPGIMTEAVQKVEEKGFVYFDWSVDSNDAGGAKTEEEIFENVTSAIREDTSNVVLMHDSNGHGVTLEALDDIIKWCLEEGYEILPLEETSYDAHHRVNN